MPKFHSIPLTTGAQNASDDAATTSLDLSSSFNSDPIWVGTVDSGSIQIVTPATGAPIGSFKLQRSNHPPDSGQWSTKGNDPPSGWEWTDWSGSSQSVNGSTGSPFDWDLTKITCRWLRVVWTRTSGTGTATGYANVKGPS